ncbi:MAG TPA: hypothetical protein VJ817_01245 [Gemmatimonadales bacterium]|nr:hypothetical protein [Gemmatimonadales bacterium]
MRFSRPALLALAASLPGCGGSTAPSDGLTIAVTPAVLGSFSGHPGLHQYSALVTDAGGAIQSNLVLDWSVSPSSTGINVLPSGLVGVLATAQPGDYAVRASTGGATGSALLRVLPAPTGRIYFSSGGRSAALYVKDFSNAEDALALSITTGTITGIEVNPSAGILVLGRGFAPDADIYRMNLDGSGVVKLTTDGAGNQSPVFHPVTGEIYFSRRAPGDPVTQIWKMAIDGSGLIRVTTGDQNKSLPAISPDGQRLAWSETYPGANGELVTATIQGTSPVRLTDRPGNDSEPHWISNSRVTWSGMVGSNLEIFAADLSASGVPMNLTQHPDADTGPSRGCSSGTITFLSRRGGKVFGGYQLDLATGLVTEYVLPTDWAMGIARRVCP